MNPSSPFPDAPAADNSPIMRVINRKVLPGKEQEFERLTAQLLDLSRVAGGHIATDIHPPIPGIQDSYVIVHHLDSFRSLNSWLANPQRQQLVHQIQPLLAAPEFDCLIPKRRHRPGEISTVIAYNVRADKISEFTRWRNEISAASKKQKGFRGSHSFDTFGEAHPRFVTIIRFSSQETLLHWLNSEARSALIKKVQPLIETAETIRVGTGFEGWFGQALGPDIPPPSKWRQGLMILAALFPCIMILRAFLGGLFELMPFALAFLVLLICDVAILTFLIMPYFSRAMAFWLHPQPGRFRWLRELAGLAIILTMVLTTLAIELTISTHMSR